MVPRERAAAAASQGSNHPREPAAPAGAVSPLRSSLPRRVPGLPALLLPSPRTTSAVGNSMNFLDVVEVTGESQEMDRVRSGQPKPHNYFSLYNEVGSMNFIGRIFNLNIKLKLLWRLYPYFHGAMGVIMCVTI